MHDTEPAHAPSDPFKCSAKDGLHIYLCIKTIDKNFTINANGLIIHESLNKRFTHVHSFHLRLKECRCVGRGAQENL